MRIRTGHRFFPRLGTHSRQKRWKLYRWRMPCPSLLLSPCLQRWFIRRGRNRDKSVRRKPFPFRGTTAKSFQNEQKGRLMRRCLGHSSRCRGKLFAISDKCCSTFECTWKPTQNMKGGRKNKRKETRARSFLTNLVEEM